jgi:hypothetical protein
MGDYRPAGSKVWSPEEWEEYSRLETEEDDAEAAAAAAIQLHGELQDKMGVQLGPEKKWNHKDWPKAEQDKYNRLLGEFRKFSKIAHEARNQQSALVAKLKQKYPAASLAKKKTIAEEATTSDVFEKLKFAPPGPTQPLGGPGYQEANASFGKGRTRRHKRRRHRRKHRKTLRRK